MSNSYLDPLPYFHQDFPKTVIDPYANANPNTNIVPNPYNVAAQDIPALASAPAPVSVQNSGLVPNPYNTPSPAQGAVPNPYSIPPQNGVAKMNPIPEIQITKFDARNPITYQSVFDDVMKNFPIDSNKSPIPINNNNNKSPRYETSTQAMHVQLAKPDNPLYLSFKNPAFPANLITAENALEYFCNASNVFYDMGSCNQTLRMQNINRPVEECLRTMEGVQFTLWHAGPPLFIICKQRRSYTQNGGFSVTPLAYYYINNGLVLQCPDMYSVLQSRLLGAIEPLKNAFDQVTSFSRYNAAKGYYWEFKGKISKSNEEKEEEKKLDQRATNFQTARTAAIIDNLFNEFPPETSSEPAKLKKEKKLGDATEASSASNNKPSTSNDAAPSGAPVFVEPMIRPK